MFCYLLDHTESETKEGMEGLLMREACYRAIGLASYDFYSHVDFAAWFVGQLEPELRAARPPFAQAIMRRSAGPF